MRPLSRIARRRQHSPQHQLPRHPARHLRQAPHHHPARVPLRPRPRVITGQTFVVRSAMADMTKQPSQQTGLRADSNRSGNNPWVSVTPLSLSPTERLTRSNSDEARKWSRLTTLTPVANSGRKNGTPHTPIRPVMDHVLLLHGTMDESMHSAPPVNCVVSMQIPAPCFGVKIFSLTIRRKISSGLWLHHR
jgi:hypothetical protein